ncbi:MAG: hypothetical protein M1144_03300 [Candidatus Thermoplasmatota archaeon]|jgi:DNA-binding beta-propeller fold protein YncE|nr:hypothetical protein [Candidatus Thermoplasmatota archaeon]MCL5984912.1 hypothetical protein [Candidatus Thermoplasmatota archaeon]
MVLKEIARIRLPEHPADGGFDHAAVDGKTDRLYVAHTSNDSVDVIDLRSQTYLRSLEGLKGVAGVWVNDELGLLFTSNRGEDTASAFAIESTGERELFRIPTGARPNGMAFDPGRELWMIAGVGNPKLENAPPSLTFVDTRNQKVVGRLALPGRTRWAIYHRATDAFYVNIADPPAIAMVRAGDISKVHRMYPIPAKGPHGLEQDPNGEVLYCACDEAVLATLNLRTGGVEIVGPLAGSPDVLWVDPGTGHLFAATDEAATVDVFGIQPPRHLETVPTSPGAHTLTVDAKRHQVHVFLPESHEDLVLQDPTA